MPHPPLKALRVFEVVARSGSFRKAAEELCVSQSAVSHQIKHLEEWFGRPLFNRSGHRPQLLEHSEALAHALALAFQNIDTACQLAQGGVGQRALVIAALPSVAVGWLIPRLGGFRSRHPDIAIRVTYALHGQQIDFSDINLAFVFSKNPPDLPDAQSYLFLPGTSAPVCSPALFNTGGGKTTIEAIFQAGLLHDTNLTGWHDWLRRAGINPVPPLPGPVFEDFNLLHAAALAGEGVALCPLALISAELATKQLIQLSSDTMNEDHSYYLVRRLSGDTDTVKAADAFASWLFETRNN